MRATTILATLPLAAILLACGETTQPTPGGPVQMQVQQSLTGPTSSAGHFQLSGAFTDEGTTTEELTFGGPLDRPPVPLTFRRSVAGRLGTMVVTGSATLDFTSPTQATLAGTWTIESATGEYATLTGTGTLSGSANFGATPATATIGYTGTMERR